LQEIFPLLSSLGNDKDAEVRNSCVEQVSRISSVCPAPIRTGQLENLYLKFMQDKHKKVKINAFKYLGRFLETLQNLQISDEFLEQYVETGMKSKNKELLFYCAYNIPGILFILKGDSWSSLEELYTKLSKSQDVRIKKTLAYSIHEIAKLIGQEQSEDLLIKFVNLYLNDNLKEIKSGVIRHLHEFCAVISPDERLQFLNVYKSADEDRSMVDLYAESIGDFAVLFQPENVTPTLLPLFYNL
jgi:serine/threonine-protein phosphatase 4 regulatory subunit 1